VPPSLSTTNHHIEDFWYGEGGLSDTCRPQTLGKYRNDMKQFLSFCYRREWTPYATDFLLDGIREKSTRVNRNRYRMTRAELRRATGGGRRPSGHGPYLLRGLHGRADLGSPRHADS
jgi:hypothetical protein